VKNRERERESAWIKGIGRRSTKGQQRLTTATDLAFLTFVHFRPVCVCLGGDEHKFKEINAAYEILSDPEKRAKYDRYGLEGVDDESGAAARGEDLFSMVFGGGGRGRGGSGRAGPRKGPAVNHPIKVSLEDLYNGKTVKLAINRKVIVGDVKECTACNGQGVRLEIRQIAPGMITQMQRTCDRCEGQGKIAQTKTERKVLEVHIEKGMSNGERVVFRNHADEVPGMEAGDVNFVIQEKPHDFFKRKGADLLATQTVTLNQALCGYSVRRRLVLSRDVISGLVFLNDEI
jgi:DnaJ family protein A protein 2